VIEALKVEIFSSSPPSQEMQIALGEGFLQGKADDTGGLTPPRTTTKPCGNPAQAKCKFLAW